MLFFSSQIYIYMLFLSQATIGPLKVNLKCFEDNMEANKLDLEKMSRNMVLMAWPPADRALRSLEGGKSNRFPDAAPKLPATPEKVSAILGKLYGSAPSPYLTDGSFPFDF